MESKESEIMKKVFLLVAFCMASPRIMAQPKTLSLDECVQIAVDKNPQIVQSRFYLKSAGKDVLTGVSRFLPYVDATLGYSHSVAGPSSQLRIDPRTGIPVSERPNEISSWSSSAGLNVNQSLFSGSNIFNLSRGLNMKKSAEYDFSKMKQDIIFRVKERYYTLLKTQKLLEVQEESIKLWEESYKRAQVQYRVGKAPKSDELKAKVQLEQARLALIEAQNNLSVSKASLNHVLGFDVDTEIQVLDSPETTDVEFDYQEASSNSMKNHPSVLKGMTDAKASKAGIGAAASDFLPSVSAYYGYSWRNEKFDQIKNILNQDYNWYTGVQLSIPLFTGFSRIASVGKARLEYQSAKEALLQTEKDVALELKQAYFALGQSKKKIVVSQDAEAAAEEDLRLNREKYSLGSGTMLDLINAQVSYTTSRSDRIQAAYDIKINFARLLRAMGKLEK
jgi:TolC family type I secretion outer membrane protein